MEYPIDENVKKVLDFAEAIAKKYSSHEIGTEHILYGLVKAEKGIASQILTSFGVGASGLEELFESDVSIVLTGSPSLTLRVKQTFLTAFQICRQVGDTVISSEHLLSALVLDQASIATRILNEVYKIAPRSIIAALSTHYNNSGLDKLASGGAASQNPTAVRKKSPLPAQLLEMGVDITQKAIELKIDPIIGRQDEIERIIEILCRKTKNNPVLIGEPGVGKTAVIEGLARAIVEGRVPDLLRGKIIYSLEMGSLMAGTKYRGALEERVKDAVNLIKEQNNIIVFIDELHTLVQAKSKDGEVSPVDILKPYLARGELQTIGATTTDEYRKYIEKDKALERRFQPIMVNPPSVEDTIKILEGLKENYEAFHKVQISSEALVTAAKLSDRYIQDRFLPDKAIDLIDEAMSRAKISKSLLPKEVKVLEDEVSALELKKTEAIKSEDYAAAQKFRGEIDKLVKKIEAIKLGWTKEGERAVSVISADDIARVISKWTSIPLTRLTETEQQKLINLEEILHKRVIGQEDAVRAVSKALRRARAGLKDPTKPIGTFLFLGSTGVGKTELSKALAEAMFDSEAALIRLDMSEFMEKQSVSKLIGAPPGYVGFDEGGQLTEQIRRKPYSVVLFDEIEKAHIDVTNALLQIMDDGRLTDSQGRQVSFKNAIIILTSNVGADKLTSRPKSLGFNEGGADKEQSDLESIILKELKKAFKPEFLNRIDVTTVFKKLTKPEISKIATILISNVEKNLSEQDIKLKVTTAAKNHIVEKGYDAEYGARPLKRVVQTLIEDTVADALLSNSIKSGDTVAIDYKNGKIVVG